MDSESLMLREDLPLALREALVDAIGQHPEFGEMLFERSSKGRSAVLDYMDDRTVNLTVRSGE